MLIAANAFVALTILAAGGAYGYVKWRLGQIHTKHLTALSTNTGSASGGGGGRPFTLLVVGSDTRALATSTDSASFGGAADVGGQRSDTIILVRVVPAARQMMMMSIPRDLWGPIPGHGSNRINSAFDAGPNLLIQTIETDLGIPVNHYVELNFDTFRDISNAVGGVSFYFPTPAKDVMAGLSVNQPGCVSLSGDQALAFVRSRHYQYYQGGYWHFEAASDLARIQRQQAFIKKMISKAKGEFTNPFALNAVLAGITKNLTVDSGFSQNLMISLARGFRSMDSADIPNITLPTYPFTTAGGAEVLGLQQPQAAQAIAAFNTFGTTPPAPPRPAASTPATAPVTAPPVRVNPASIGIKVANGTGSPGQAGQLAQALSGLGYHTAVAGSPGYGHATTQVRYAPDSLVAAQQVAAQIPGGATLVADAALTPTIYNLEIVTGSTYPSTSAAGSATATTGPAGSAVTSTTVPGTNPAQYQLPGSPPGQPAPSC